MRTACEPLFWLSHSDQRMTEWKSCTSFSRYTLFHKPPGRACMDLRGGASGLGSETCQGAVSADFILFYFISFNFIFLFLFFPAPKRCPASAAPGPAISLLMCTPQSSSASKSDLADTDHFWLVFTPVAQLVNSRDSNFQQSSGDKYLGLVTLASRAEAARTVHFTSFVPLATTANVKSLLILTMQN